MACCLTAPGYYLNQRSLIINAMLWHSSEFNLIGISSFASFFSIDQFMHLFIYSYAYVMHSWHSSVHQMICLHFSECEWKSMNRRYNFGFIFLIRLPMLSSLASIFIIWSIHALIYLLIYLHSFIYPYAYVMHSWQTSVHHMIILVNWNRYVAQNPTWVSCSSCHAYFC